MSTTSSNAVALRASGANMQVGAGQMGVSEFDAIERQANMLASSSIVPAAFRNKPADIVAVAAVGREVGLSVMASMQSIHIIEGKPSMSAQLMGALVRARGHSLAITVMEDDVVEMVGTRVDNGNTMRFSFTQADAVAAKLAHKDNWKKYFRAMAQARCITQICRGLFADVIAGISYNPEEAADIAGVSVAVDPEGEVVAIAGEVIPTRVVPEPEAEAAEVVVETPAAAPPAAADEPKRAARRKSAQPAAETPIVMSPSATVLGADTSPAVDAERYATMVASLKSIPVDAQAGFRGWCAARGVKWQVGEMTTAMADITEERIAQLVGSDSDVEDVADADVSVEEPTETSSAA